MCINQSTGRSCEARRTKSWRGGREKINQVGRNGWCPKILRAQWSVQTGVLGGG
jgi:hypothetical protein